MRSHLQTRHTRNKQITAFQDLINTVHSCAMKCHVPIIEHVKGESSMVDPEV